MLKTISLFFHDPILLAASIVLLITLAILIWAIMAWYANEQELGNATDEDSNPNPNFTEPAGNSGLLAAHLKEMSNQLADINERFALVEKKLNEPGNCSCDNNSSEINDPSQAIELIKQLHTKLDVLTLKDSTVQDIDLKPLESKLEGIHKLLILLTDSEDSSGLK